MNRPTAWTIARHLADLSADAAAADRPDADLLRRFLADGDGSAFAALVRRHGPMVWATCRQLLPNPADAEDAFQATFLALVRSAGKVRATAALGGWLHGVAVKASLKVRRAEARRKGREKTAAGPEAGRPVPDSAWDGLLAAVHEEVEGLPEGLRTAFVLCDLEGVPQPAAAARLGWKPGTLTGRLSKARQHLLDRLTRRGLAPAAVAGGLGVTAAGAAVPSALNQTVLKLAADPLAASAAVTELVTEMTAMTWSKTKLLAAGLMVAGGLGLGVGSGRMANVAAQIPATAEPARPVEAPPPQPPLPAKATVPAAPVPPASANPAGRTVWEYRYAGLPDDPTQFIQVLDRYGAEGWEYAGAWDHMQAFTGDEARRRQVRARNQDVQEGYAKENPAKFGDANRGMYANGLLVFKRPRTAGQAVAAAGGFGGSAAAEARAAAQGLFGRTDRPSIQEMNAAAQALTASVFQQLARQSGDAELVRFDKLPPTTREMWARNGALPPLPPDGTMDQAQFTKWYMDWVKFYANQQRPAPAPKGQPPAGGATTVMPGFGGGGDTARPGGVPGFGGSGGGGFGGGRGFAPPASTPGGGTPDNPFVPGGFNTVATTGPVDLAHSQALTAAEQLERAKTHQKVAALRLEKYKEAHDLVEKLSKRGQVTPDEVADARVEVRLCELHLEEARIRVEAAERRAAEEAKPRPGLKPAGPGPIKPTPADRATPAKPMAPAGPPPVPGIEPFGR